MTAQTSAIATGRLIVCRSRSACASRPHRGGRLGHATMTRPRCRSDPLRRELSRAITWSAPRCRPCGRIGGGARSCTTVMVEPIVTMRPARCSIMTFATSRTRNVALSELSKNCWNSSVAAPEQQRRFHQSDIADHRIDATVLLDARTQRRTCARRSHPPRCACIGESEAASLRLHRTPTRVREMRRDALAGPRSCR